MKLTVAYVALLVAAATPLPGAEEKTQFNLDAPMEFSEIWQPNTSLWRELTATRTNAVILLGKSDFRVTGPLINALRPTSRRPEERSSRGRRLLAVPLGLLSLVSPQKMGTPPETGPGYFAWRTPTGTAWETTAMRRPATPGSADNPVQREPVGKLISVGK